MLGSSLRMPDTTAVRIRLACGSRTAGSISSHTKPSASSDDCLRKSLPDAVVLSASPWMSSGHWACGSSVTPIAPMTCAAVWRADCCGEASAPSTAVLIACLSAGEMASHAACLSWTCSADLAVKQFLSSTPASWRVLSSLTSFESSRASRLRSSGCEREYERAKRVSQRVKRSSGCIVSSRVRAARPLGPLGEVRAGSGNVAERGHGPAQRVCTPGWTPWQPRAAAPQAGARPDPPTAPLTGWVRCQCLPWLSRTALLKGAWLFGCGQASADAASHKAASR